jgi:hypothetical protein
MNMKELKFNLNVNEINLVLKALGNLPYYQVCTLIEKLQQQANAQLTQPNGSGLNKEQLTGENIIQQ